MRAVCVRAELPVVKQGGAVPASGTKKAEEPEEPQYFRGQFLEVLDTANKWLPAEVLHVDVAKSRIYVHYDGFSAKWDEWLKLDDDSDRQRIRTLGADIAESVEEKERRVEEESFRADMKTAGLEIVDCDKDGNCMFRSVAHQIYNDPERHAEVRKMCYDHMVRDRAFFSMFVADDFDEYITRQRRLNEWGDHVELEALREVFNKNLLVYDRDNVQGARLQPLSAVLTGRARTAPRSIGEHHTELGTMRLSFHGQSHFNSVRACHGPAGRPLQQCDECARAPCRRWWTRRSGPRLATARMPS
jgi:hypothetical protein